MAPSHTLCPRWGPQVHTREYKEFPPLPAARILGNQTLQQKDVIVMGATALSCIMFMDHKSFRL